MAWQVGDVVHSDKGNTLYVVLDNSSRGVHTFALVRHHDRNRLGKIWLHHMWSGGELYHGDLTDDECALIAKLMLSL